MSIQTLRSLLKILGARTKGIKSLRRNMLHIPSLKQFVNLKEEIAR